MNIDNGMLPMMDLVNNSDPDIKACHSQKDKIKSVAGQFSAIFVDEILQNSRKSKLSSGGLFDSEGTKMSEKLYDQQISLAMTKDDSFGITKMIENELNSQGT